MADLERIQKATPGTLSQQWSEDGAVVDPGTVTIGITKADGTVLVAGGTATSGTGTSPRTFNLTTTHTANLDRLQVTWTSSLKGTLISYVEVVGGFLFGLAEIRGVTPINDTVSYLTADIADTRTAVEQAIEQACGVAFVPRYAFERYSGDGSTSLLLRRPLPSSVRSATIGGTALSAPQLADLTMATSGAIYSTLTTWTLGQNNIVVGYEHGFQDPPAEIRRAAVMLAKVWLVGRRNPIDDRAVTFNAGADGGTYSLAVPGRNGSSFGHPDIDVAVDRYSRVTMIA
jgi:hypothetical protein